METKKEKRGFWASLFMPKPCSCSVQFEEVTEGKAVKQLVPEEREGEKVEADKKPKCSCDGSC